MSKPTDIFNRLDGPRRRLARRKLVEQIRQEGKCYEGLPDQETIDLFISQEAMDFRFDLSLHEAAILLGDETEADRPKMAPLLWKALGNEGQGIPKVMYMTQLVMTNLENKELKQEAEEAGLEVKTSLILMETLNPHHPLRAN